MKQTRFVTAQARRLVAELRRDRRRLAVLAVLLLIVVALSARSWFVSSGPAPAQAAAKRPTLSAAVSHSEPQPNPRNVREDYISRINRTLTRDLFKPNESYFPPPPEKEKKVVVMSVATTAPSEDLQVVIQRQQVLQDAKALKLHSTMSGNTRTVASVNDQMLAVGDRINDFVVTNIQPNRCIVEKHGVAVVLTIDP